MILAAGIAAVSCSTKSEFAPLASSVTVDKAEVSLEATSGTAKVTVTSDGDWISVAPSWASISPKSGNAGSTEVTITAIDNVNEWNEQMGPRKAALYFFGNGEDAGMAQVTLSQGGEAGLNSERSYSKISKKEDWDVTKAFILVVKIGDKLQAASAVPGTPDDGRYYYWNALAEVAETDGVIVRPNSNQAFKAVAVEDGKYAIQEPGGGYLYQSAGYSTSFYIAAGYDASAEKHGDIWTVDFNEDGHVVLTNTTCGDGNAIMQYLNGSYTEFATYTDYPAADCVVLDLYQDSAAATDEILKAEDVTVVASAVSATIPVTANKQWSVRNHDEWIKSFAKNEAGNAVEITFDANTSTEAARTAEFTIIGQTTNVVVTLTQGKIATTIAELLAQVTSTNQNDASPFEATLLTPAVVSYVNGSSVYIEDASGAIKYFKSGHNFTAGTTLSGTVSGKAYIRNGVPQISVLDEGYTKGEGGTIPETEMTIADLLKNYDANLSRRIVLKGVTVTDGIGSGDRNGKIAQDGKDIALYDESKAVVIAKDAIGNLIAYPSKYNANKRLSVWETAHFTPKQ